MKNAKRKKQNKPQTIPVQPVTPERKRLFTILAIALPFLFFLALEFGLRLARYGETLDLFVSAPSEISEYVRINPEVSRRFFFMQSTLPKPVKDLFLKVKPANGYRVFVLGESTGAGYPYGNNAVFSRILHARLNDAFPDRRIEVVNLSLAAVSSYALLDFMDELVKQKPDAVLIYAGHNEFYGAMGVASMESLGQVRWVVKSYLKLLRFRTFQLLRNATGAVRKAVSRAANREPSEDPTATLMERIVGDQEIPSQSALFRRGLKQFEANLGDIVAKAQKAGATVVLSELVSNVRDQKPFIPGSEKPSAKDCFLQAKQFEAEGRFAEARDAYVKAKDLDALRFRASEDFNDVIRRIGSATGSPVVPMKSAFERASANGLVGDSFMTDHLHPNLDGYFLMADAFFETMKKNRLISSVWNDRLIRPSDFYRMDWGFTRLDTVNAALNIRYLKGSWPFQPKNKPNRSLETLMLADAVDSLALRMLIGKNVGFETGHLWLAKRLLKAEHWAGAFDEYKALVHTIPYEQEFYEGVIGAASKMGDYPRALPVLERGRGFRETGFIDKWIGQILLLEEKVPEAIPFLEKARTALPGDEPLARNLRRAYALLQKTSIPASK